MVPIKGVLSRQLVKSNTGTVLVGPESPTLLYMEGDLEDPFVTLSDSIRRLSLTNTILRPQIESRHRFDRYTSKIPALNQPLP